MTGDRQTVSSLPDPDYCLYATKILLPLLMQLEKELEGVIRDDDIEYVHRSRVATRRIRAAFPLFSSCFPRKDGKKWEREIRVLTRALGDARDLDVQIEVVRKILEEKKPGFSEKRREKSGEDSSSHIISLPAGSGSPASPPRPVMGRIRQWIRNRRKISPSEESRKSVGSANPLTFFPLFGDVPADPLIPGLDCLLIRLVQQRRVMQPAVEESVSRFLSGQTIEHFSHFLQDLRIHSMLKGEGFAHETSYENAYLHIMGRIADLFWYEPYLGDPSLKEKHHTMRIMAKRLRYTIEAFSDLYDEPLKGELKSIKKLQELLGDIHDCDVWVDLLPRFLGEEEERFRSFFGSDRFFSQVSPGIVALIEDRHNTRNVLFTDLCRFWEDLKDEGFWDRFAEKIAVPVQAGLSGPADSDTPGPVIIALISDIHANLPALEAVLADARDRGAVVVLNAGDMTGYGPFPNEVVSTLRKQHVLSVIGNYDLSVLSKQWKRGKPRSREKRVAMRWAYHHLSDENRLWLKSLPRSLRLPVRGLTLLVTHGSPDSITEYLDDGTPETRLVEIASTVQARVVVTGHSHRPSAREIGGVWFVNTGSVGRSEDGDTRACYALITVDPFSLTHIRVPYDIGRTVDAIHESHLPEAFARIVEEGRPLEAVGRKKSRR